MSYGYSPYYSELRAMRQTTIRDKRTFHRAFFTKGTYYYRLEFVTKDRDTNEVVLLLNRSEIKKLELVT